MSKSLSHSDNAILAKVLRVRGLRPGTEAERKRMERLAAAGYLAKSKMPRGPQLFRLSRKGAEQMGAPKSWAASPSPGVAGEMLVASALTRKSDNFLFLTKPEFDELMAGFPKENEQPKFMSRLLLRRMMVRDNSGRFVQETHLHVLLAELRPTDELVSRVAIIVQNLRRSPVFSEMIETRVFGVTLAVASDAAKKSLESKNLPVETAIEVVADLQDIIRA